MSLTIYVGTDYRDRCEMKEIKKIFLFGIRYFKKSQVTLILFCSIVGTVILYPLPILQKYLFDTLVQQNFTKVSLLLIALIVILILQLISKILINYVSFFAEERSHQCLKLNLLKNLYEIDFKKVEAYEKEYLHNRIDVDSKIICKYIVQILKELLPNMFLFAFSVLYVFMVCKELLLLSLLFMMLVIVSFILINRRLITLNSEGKEKANQTYAVFSENLSNLQIIKTNNLQMYEEAKVLKAVKGYLATYKKIMGFSSVYLSFSSSLQIVLSVVIMCFGAYNVMNGKASVGDIVALMGMANYIVNPAYILIQLLSSYPEASVSMRRIEEFLAERTNIFGTIRAKRIDNIAVNIEEFSYNENVILHNFSHEFKRGNFYIIAGENGAGKSSLLKILSRLYIDYKGEIIINHSMPIEEIELKNYLEHISFIEQKPFIFSGSIWENIFADNMLNDKNDMNEIFNKFKKSLCDLPKGLETNIIDKSGNSLSGGECRKISILRGLYRSTDVILLDEPTNSLDSSSIEELFRILTKIKKDKIIIMVTHFRDYDCFADEIIEIQS